VRWPSEEFLMKSARPSVPGVPTPFSEAAAKLESERSAAARRRANSSSVSHTRFPNTFGRCIRMRMLLRYSYWKVCAMLGSPHDVLPGS
jgi:hypothetical protein